MHLRNYYEILGVSRNASLLEIKRAYHQLAIQYHPDHNPDDKRSEERFKEINDAYSLLSDREKRSKYDTTCSFRRSEGTFHPFSFTNDNSYPPPPPQKKPVNGSDIEVDVEISFREAVFGAEKVLAFSRKSHPEQLKFTIPPATDNGSRVCISGKGGQGVYGGSSGDLIIIIRVMPDPVFTRNGLDLTVECKIPLQDILLESCLDVPTLNGSTRITVPKNVMSGTVICLKEYGIHVPETGTTGDLHVRITVEAPEPVEIEAATMNNLAEYSVLMVDDEPYTLQMLQRMFHHEPYKILCADSGPKGLKILEETAHVSVIVSDQRMPVMSGTDFLARSREIAPDAVRMLLTSYADIDATVAAINKGGVSHFISKPCDSGLVQTVHNGVLQYHLIRENRRQQEIITGQNEILASWNKNLKSRVLTQTTQLSNLLNEVRELHSRQKGNFRGVIESLASLGELRTPKARHHATNCATLSIAIARTLGLSECEIETIGTAALLHDIGKSFLDVSYAEGDDGFTAEELARYRKHPVLAQLAIDSIEDLRPAGILIRHHHERYDGKGFPDGLSGDAIPLGAAILSIANCCDREIGFHFGSNAVDYALENIAKLSGTVFLPKLLPLISKPAHDLYDHRFAQIDLQPEKTVPPGALKPGMILTRDLFSRSGLLLLQARTELDKTRIQSLQRAFSLDPMMDEIHIAMRQQQPAG